MVCVYKRSSLSNHELQAHTPNLSDRMKIMNSDSKCSMRTQLSGLWLKAPVHSYSISFFKPNDHIQLEQCQNQYVYFWVFRYGWLEKRNEKPKNKKFRLKNHDAWTFSNWNTFYWYFLFFPQIANKWIYLKLWVCKLCLV